MNDGHSRSHTHKRSLCILYQNLINILGKMAELALGVDSNLGPYKSMDAFCSSWPRCRYQPSYLGDVQVGTRELSKAIPFRDTCRVDPRAVGLL
jgi:hypothetical protein